MLPKKHVRKREWRRFNFALFPAISFWMAVSFAGRAVAAEQSSASSPQLPKNFAAEAHSEYLKARQEYQQDSTNSEAAWQFGRACFDWAEYASSKSDRAALANEGIDACRKLVARHPESAAGHYYLAMDLGQLARTKWLGALRIVREMEEEFTVARSLDEHFDFGGPDRNLGLLYWQAPSIGSIGDRRKARIHLDRAAQLAPLYPENRLNLIEAELDWDDQNSARQQLEKLEQLWPEMRRKFSGEEWESSWPDWEKRFNKLKKQLQSGSKTLQSPRHKD